MTRNHCRVSLVVTGTECPAFCPVCGETGVSHCPAIAPRKLSTADLDLRGMSLPAPRPEDIRALHLKLAAAAREAALKQTRGAK